MEHAQILVNMDENFWMHTNTQGNNLHISVLFQATGSITDVKEDAEYMP